MADRILVVGESLVDVILAPDGSTEDFPGGSPANLAVALTRLGAAVELATAFGPDERGDLLAAHFHAAGVRLVGDPRILPRTSTAVATVDGDGTARYEFDMLTELVAPPTVPERIHVHTGSIGAAAEPGSTAVARTLAAHAPTATVSYDINARPAVTGAGHGLVRHVEAIARLSDVVKASDEDLAIVYPGVPLDTAAHRLLELGPVAVVVTHGPDGAACYTNGGVIRVPGLPVEVVDTIGAGDSFGAALLDGLWRAGLLGAARRPDLRTTPGDLWRAVLARATAAAVLSVSRPGADPPTLAELDDAHGVPSFTTA